ncbi:CHRD domain-containing protein [Halegenticoccus soli]|uniref:CHRD domain-containing protein n=1 Tax=Halegenticoccus soli TaxID=1985678 RepID=UPI000C6CA575|nr:CHRD domain-containing protein [Halegenticoccus soli]
MTENEPTTTDQKESILDRSNGGESRRSFVKKATLAAGLLAIDLGATGPAVAQESGEQGANQPPVFSSGVLTGSQEVPPVQTTARGTTLFQRARDGDEVRFVLIVDAIENVTQAHIHLGREGENGEVVAFLFGQQNEDGEFVGPLEDGVTVDDLTGLSTGDVTDDDLVGPLEGEQIERLLSEMRAGNTYVNVHTEQRPEGEIRGQIRRVPLRRLQQ